ncbi:MAG TPA: hypothetical protein DCM73_08890, partial [Clostridiales bacterium]|nr:hypothetical protein [Clostridiales bacterium]
MKSKEYLAILQKILHNIDEGVHVLDKNGNTIIYNEAMSKLEKMETKEVIKKPFSEVFKNLNIENSTLLKALKSRVTTSDLKQTYLNKDGREITTINTTLPIEINDEVIAVVEVAKNITKMTEMSHTILKLQNEIGKPEKAKTKKIRKYNFNNIVGSSSNFVDVIERAKKASKNSASVFIFGETGTGKELIAQSIHYESIRKNKPFIAQNCAALPESLLEGLLFGTSKGGFTGAVDRAGLFEQANGGTILLDEIGDISPNLQSRLLRVLQERQIMRIGGSRMINIDTRIISATNRDLMSEVEKGNFRKDLYYRLNVISICIEPLKNRKEDILPLMSRFLGSKYNQLTDHDKKLLFAYTWPGNVRELENAAIHYKTLSVLPKYLLDTPTAPAISYKPNNLINCACIEMEILKIIMENTQLYHGIGRMQLNAQLRSLQLYIGDASLRDVLKSLQEKGLITIGRGRIGTK